ncbi:MAG: MFS transporter [Betaproteobacteria bacterium]
MIDAAVARYAAFFRLPDVSRLFVMAMVARLPIGTVTLALLLHVRAVTGSFAAAGVAVGCYLGASAITAPFIGRWIDRHGARSALISMGVVSPAALLVVWLAEPLGLAPAQLVAAAAIAGASAPPITVLTRTMWRHRFADDASRKTAFALDSVLVELAFTLGPATIALLLAIGSPAVAFGAAFFFSVIAVPIFLASPALRYWRHEPGAERSLLGPLTEPRLLAVFATTFFLTMSLGLLEIGYPGFAASVSNPPLAGVLLAVNSAGSALGGLLYGGMHWPLAGERQLRRVLALLTVPIALHTLVGATVPLAMLAFVTGLLIAPTLTMVSLLVSTYAPSRYATEAFTWSATCIISGIGAGNAIGGLLVERFGTGYTFGGSACAALLAAACSLTTLRGTDRVADA